MSDDDHNIVLVPYLDDCVVSVIIEYVTIDDEMVRFAQSSQRFNALAKHHVTKKIDQFWQKNGDDDNDDKTTTGLNKVVDQSPFLLEKLLNKLAINR